MHKRITAVISIKTADDDHCSVRCPQLHFEKHICSLTCEVLGCEDQLLRSSYCKECEEESAK